MKAIIAGGGIAGLAAARFLAVKGWDIVILEAAPSRRRGGYMIDFTGSGYDALERAGLIDELRERHHDMNTVAYQRESGRVRSKINYKVFSASLQGRLLAVMRGDVEDVLFNSLPEQVEIRFSTKISKVLKNEGAVEVELNDGSIEKGDLLIGADGIHSDLREMIFGPEKDYIRYLGYHTAAFIFENQQIADEVKDSFLMLSLPKRQVGVYDLGDGRVSSFFAHTAEVAERPRDPAKELRRVYGDLGWHLPKILDAADKNSEIYYDWIAQVEMPSWSKGRVVLLGDAGYAVSLLAGQGASLAIAGAWILTNHIGDGNLDAGLVSFQKEMMPEVLKKQAAGRKTANWFVPPTRFHNMTRDLFLNATRIPGLSFLLKRFFAPSLKSVVKR